MSPGNRMTSVGKADRVEGIDVARGLALFGVLVVNLFVAFRVPFMAAVFGPPEAFGRVDGLVDSVIELVVAGKAYTALAILFGVGLAVQSERPSPAAFLVRRMLALLAIGVAHLVLLWDGDVLAMYAIAGLALLPLLRRSKWTLLALGIAICVFVDLPLLPSPFPAKAAGETFAADALRIYGTGSYLDTIRFRLHELADFMISLDLRLALRSAGIMLLGAAAWRFGVFRRPRALVGLALVGLAVGVVATLLGTTKSPRQIPFAFGYLALAVLLAHRLSFFAAAGRMTLTNYVMQSLVLSILFYGYGFGLTGKVSLTACLAIAIGFFAAQVVASNAWLARYQLGPLEWLWRGLSYGRWPSMRRQVGRGPTKGSSVSQRMRATSSAITPPVTARKPQ